MSEQEQTPKQRSPANVATRLSYDCVISSIKAFVNNFNNITEEEKKEYKSMQTHIKSLDKCMSVLKPNLMPSKRSVKSKPETESATVAAAPASVSEVVVESSAAAESSKPAKKASRAKQPRESSQTAEAVAQLKEEVAVAAAPEQKPKRAKAAKKPTAESSAPAQEVAASAPAPTAEVASEVPEVKKPRTRTVPKSK